MPSWELALIASSPSQPCLCSGCRIASKPAGGAIRALASLTHTSVPRRPGQVHFGDHMPCTRPLTRAWPQWRSLASSAGRGRASSVSANLPKKEPRQMEPRPGQVGFWPRKERSQKRRHQGVRSLSNHEATVAESVLCSAAHNVVLRAREGAPARARAPAASSPGSPLVSQCGD